MKLVVLKAGVLILGVRFRLIVLVDRLTSRTGSSPVLIEKEAAETGVESRLKPKPKPKLRLKKILATRERERERGNYPKMKLY